MAIQKFNVSQGREYYRTRCSGPNRYGYVYGGTGGFDSVALLQAKFRQYGTKMGRGYYENNGDFKAGKCARWLGKDLAPTISVVDKAVHVADCSNSIMDMRRAFSLVIGSKSANGLYQEAVSAGMAHGTIESMPKVPGILLFIDEDPDDNKTFMGHVGFYYGNGYVCQSGGVITGYSYAPLKKGWTHWAYAPWWIYDLPSETTPPVTPPPTNTGLPGNAPAWFNIADVPYYGVGDRSTGVKYMQQLLLALGYKLPKYNADGDFGKETLASLKAFQKDKKLEVDGICGPLTWSALLGVVCH